MTKESLKPDCFIEFCNMKIRVQLILLLVLSALMNEIKGQSNSLHQNIRGYVRDKESLSGISKAALLLFSNKDTFYTEATESGDFIFNKVPLGRYTLKVSAEAYKEAVIPDIVTNSAKEVVLNIDMESDVVTSKEIKINAKGNPAKTNNDMVLVSGRQFTIDQTNRYAGSFNDPSRMATNFAGVSATGGQRNDIVIRGNSPSGLLWRLEGIDIPNPNHFASQGATGGPVNILNNNNLANSDFITGAFPAEYGNATSGVFDLKMRNGNNQKREYMGQIGFNGVELGLEGPFSKKSGSSYMVNYRYSTLALFEKMGFNLTFAGVPFYQDVSFKFNFPKTKTGEWSLTGIGGKSHITMLDSKKDTSDLSFGFGDRVNLINGSEMGAVILANTNRYRKGYVRIAAAATYQKLFTDYDTLDLNDKATLTYAENNVRTKLTTHAYLNHILSRKTTLRAGVLLSYFDAKIKDSFLNDSGFMQNLRNYQGHGGIYQTYAQLKHRFTGRFTLIGGLYYQFLGMNHTQSLEPRLSVRKQLSNKQALSFGYGLHSQMQPLEIYFGEVYDFQNHQYKRYNTGLGFSKSHQWVLGYDYQLGKSMRIKTDVYYQYLFNIPVSAMHSNQFSLINFGADFGGLPSDDSLRNTGTGNNYGIELTLEKFFSKNYYFLVTGSLFQSKYTPSDKQTYNTAFNGNFVLNALGGYEIYVGKRKQNSFAFNIKNTIAGGRRYTPVDEVKSLAERQVKYDWNKAYTQQFATYYRTDIKVSFKWNTRKIVQEWALDVQNLFNVQNPLNMTYSLSERRSKIQYQQGRLPIVQYRIYF